MNAKKGKSLVMELIDDLITEDQTDSSVSHPKQETKKKKSKSAKSQEEVVIELPTFSDVESDADSYGGVDATYKLPEPKEAKATEAQPTKADPTEATLRVDSGLTTSKNESHVEDKVRASVGRFTSLRGGGLPTAAEAALAQSENLRIAQTRILDLEQELERIRQENEQLAAAGETLRRRADEFSAKYERALVKAEQDKETFEYEKDLLSQSLEAKTREVEGLQLKIDELEMRLSTNIQKIRVRERELENRLELVKMESQALVRSKDEMILDLKRQIDQLDLELNNFRSKGQELNKELTDKQDTLRRTVKALRIALSMLEGDEEVNKPLKKAK